jgi:hypothetical protein
MKKGIIALVILLLCALVYQANAASYYGCASAAINADSTFCTTATGACTGETPVTAATALAGTHSLFANGCTITIPENVTITATKISNKDDGGDMVDGGQFTVTTTGWSNPSVLQASIEGGGTTDGCLGISGTGNLNPVFTIGSSGTPVTITGGSASSIEGVVDSRTAGNVVVYASVTGGTNSTARGYYISGASSITTFYGNATGVTSGGIWSVSNNTVSVTGDCIGSDTIADAAGCYMSGAGTFTVVGNIIAGDYAGGAHGRITWTPTPPSSGVTGHYVKFDAGGSGVFTGKNTDDASKALTTFYYIDPTDGTSDQGSATGTGGGGAWLF